MNSSGRDSSTYESPKIKRIRNYPNDPALHGITKVCTTKLTKCTKRTKQTKCTSANTKLYTLIYTGLKARTSQGLKPTLHYHKA